MSNKDQKLDENGITVGYGSCQVGKYNPLGYDLSVRERCTS